LTTVIQAVQSKNPQLAKSMILNQSNNYAGSDSRCDIPLREPLDPEYRLNRKLAKQIYNKERNDRVNERKEQLNREQTEAFEKAAKTEKKQDLKKQKEREL